MSLTTAPDPSLNMADVNLAKLYNTREFADCTFVSSEGQKFEAHRFLLSQYPRLKELIDEDQRLKLTESTEVTERLVRWLYGLEWEPENVQPTRVGIGKELTDIISLCGAAEKVCKPPRSPFCHPANALHSTPSRSWLKTPTPLLALC